jgi:hypothetical protein
VHALQHALQLLVAHQRQNGGIDARAAWVVGRVVVALDAAQRTTRFAGRFVTWLAWNVAGKIGRGSRTVQLGVAVGVDLAMLRGRRVASGNMELCWGCVEQLHEEVHEDAERGGCQVAHALGQRHGVQ